MTWSNGRHAYYGKDNGRGKRGASKILKGMKINKKSLKRAYKKLEEEKQSKSQ